MNKEEKNYMLLLNNIEREHFAFLRSYWEQIKLLPSKKQKYEMFEAIMTIQFFENDIDSISFSSQNQMLLWEGLKPILKQSQKGYLDKMGLRSQNPRQGATKAPTQHKDKDKDKDKERRERETFSNNILFSLAENVQAKEIDRYAESLDGIRNLAAYKVKLKQKIEKEHKQTLDEFESWYLADKCEELSYKYVGKQVSDYKIQLITNYLDVNIKNGGHGDSNWKFIVQVKDTEETKLIAYRTIEDVELDMSDGIDLGEVIYSKRVDE